MAVASLVDSTSVVPFLKESQDIAHSFLHLYLDEKDDGLVAMSPGPKAAAGEAPKNDVSMEVSAVVRSCVCVCVFVHIGVGTGGGGGLYKR